MSEEWKKSTYCRFDSPQCVEVNGLDTSQVEVRDSKLKQDDPFGYMDLNFTREEWQAFIDGVKQGEFDLKTNDDADAEEMMDQV